MSYSFSVINNWFVCTFLLESPTIVCKHIIYLQFVVHSLYDIGSVVINYKLQLSFKNFKLKSLKSIGGWWPKQKVRKNRTRVANQKAKIETHRTRLSSVPWPELVISMCCQNCLRAQDCYYITVYNYSLIIIIHCIPWSSDTFLTFYSLVER